MQSFTSAHSGRIILNNVEVGKPLPKSLPSQSLRSLVERDFTARTTQALSLRNADAPLHVPTSGNAPSQALKPMLPDCPCCGEPIVTIGYQQGLVDKRKGHWMVHCVNEDCDLYMATSSDIYEAWAMRGKPILGGAL